jgi:hypothetical protein
VAIVHVAFKSSSQAPPAAAHANYISRKGQYQQRGGVELVESGNMPEFARADPHMFWIAADTHERANGRTYTEVQIALPRELDRSQREDLARQATRELLGDRFAYTLAVHAPLAKDNLDQPHMHLMFSERAVDETTRGLAEERFFKRNGAKKDPAWNAREKPEEVREKWVEMMNGAMQRAGHEQRLDARSWAAQGREDLAALVEPKLLGGDDREAQERRSQVEQLRQQREQLPAPHLDQVTAIEKLEQQAEAEVARIEQRRDREVSILDKLIEKARELAVEVKEKAVSLARNVVDRVDSFFGARERGTEKETSKELEQARPPTIPIEEQLERSLAGLDKRLVLEESLDAQLANLDQRMEALARAQQEKQQGHALEIAPERQEQKPEKDIEIGRGHGHGIGH